MALILREFAGRKDEEVGVVAEEPHQSHPLKAGSHDADHMYRSYGQHNGIVPII